MRNAFVSAIVFLIVGVAPVGSAFSAPAGGGAACLTEDAGRLGQFWASSLYALEVLRPACEIEKGGCVNFTGYEGQMGIAWVRGTSPTPQRAVVRITDAVLAGGHGSQTGWTTVSFPWRQGHDDQMNPASDATAHPLYRGILNACRLVMIATECGGIAPGRVGLIGEGYGASIAVAVAALMPERVDFVIAHQPVHLSARLYSGMEDAELAALYGKAAERVGEVLNACEFAPYVKAPTLVIAGDADAYCTVAEARAVHDAIPGAKGILVLPGVGHCAPEELTGWTAAWTTWAARCPGGEQMATALGQPPAS